MSRVVLRPLAEQVVVITGASSGIGLVTARMAAARGARVMLVSRDRDTLATIAATLGERAAFAVADVGDVAAVRAAADAAVARFGRIDSWIGVAGVAIYAKLLDTPMDEHERLFRTNYFGTVHGALAAIPHLRDRGGAFITVGSIVSDLPTATMGAYAASKHAVKGYIDSLRIELMADAVPVAVTLIKPSGIDTPVGDHAANHLDGAALIPPPVYDPTLVAEAILDAAEHSRREVTVGGAGRIETLVAVHAPRLLDRFGGMLTPFLHDRHERKPVADTLNAPIGNGRERSRLQSGRKISLYRHRGKIAVGLIAAGMTVVGRRYLRARVQARTESDRR